MENYNIEINFDKTIELKINKIDELVKLSYLQFTSKLIKISKKQDFIEIADKFKDIMQICINEFHTLNLELKINKINYANTNMLSTILNVIDFLTNFILKYNFTEGVSEEDKEIKNHLNLKNLKNVKIINENKYLKKTDLVRQQNYNKIANDIIKDENKRIEDIDNPMILIEYNKILNEELSKNFSKKIKMLDNFLSTYEISTSKDNLKNSLKDISLRMQKETWEVRELQKDNEKFNYEQIKDITEIKKNYNYEEMKENLMDKFKKEQIKISNKILNFSKEIRTFNKKDKKSMTTENSENVDKNNKNILKNLENKLKIKFHEKLENYKNNELKFLEENKFLKDKLSISINKNKVNEEIISSQHDKINELTDEKNELNYDLNELKKEIGFWDDKNKKSDSKFKNIDNMKKIIKTIMKSYVKMDSLNQKIKDSIRYFIDEKDDDSNIKLYFESLMEVFNSEFQNLKEDNTMIKNNFKDIDEFSKNSSVFGSFENNSLVKDNFISRLKKTIEDKKIKNYNSFVNIQTNSINNIKEELPKKLLKNGKFKEQKDNNSKNKILKTLKYKKLNKTELYDLSNFSSKKDNTLNNNLNVNIKETNEDLSNSNIIVKKNNKTDKKLINKNKKIHFNIENNSEDYLKNNLVNIENVDTKNIANNKFKIASNDREYNNSNNNKIMDFINPNKNNWIKGNNSKNNLKNSYIVNKTAHKSELKKKVMKKRILKNSINHSIEYLDKKKLKVLEKIISNLKDSNSNNGINDLDEVYNKFKQENNKIDKNKKEKINYIFKMINENINKSDNDINNIILPFEFFMDIYNKGGNINTLSKFKENDIIQKLIPIINGYKIFESNNRTINDNGQVFNNISNNTVGNYGLNITNNINSKQNFNKIKLSQFLKIQNKDYINPKDINKSKPNINNYNKNDNNVFIKENYSSLFNLTDNEKVYNLLNSNNNYKVNNTRNNISIPNFRQNHCNFEKLKKNNNFNNIVQKRKIKIFKLSDNPKNIGINGDILFNNKLNYKNKNFSINSSVRKGKILKLNSEYNELKLLSK